MKKYLLSFILSVAAFASSYADGYTGILVTDNNGQNTYYLFEEHPVIRYQNVDGVMSACLFTEGATDPVVSVPLTDGAKLSVKYDAFLCVDLNAAGYGTFSAKEASFIATEGVTAYKASVSGETITLTALDGNIPTATGVLLYGGEDKAGSKIKLPVATSGSDANVSDNVLKPTTLADGSLATTEANSWALGSDNAFHKFSASSAYKANRAYLTHTAPTGASTRALSIGFGNDGTTNLDHIDSEASAREGKLLECGNIVIIKNGKKYNLAGQVIE